MNTNTDIFSCLLPRELALDMEGRDVTNLQSMLFALHYPIRELDGCFGPETQAAVMAFQKDHNCPATNGVLDPATKEILCTAVSEIPDRSEFRVYDRLIQTGTTYTITPFFAEGQSHEFTLRSDSPHIAVDGENLIGVSSGTAEVLIECDGRETSFIFSIRDEDEIAARIGDPKSANNLGLGLRSRMKGLESYTGDLSQMVLLAGDCYMDDRLFMRDFEKRFAGKNVYTVALSGSVAEQWYNCIPKINHLQPPAMVLNIGINNIRHKNTAPHTIESVIELFRLIHENMPDTMIYWWNLIPHISMKDEYFVVNAVNAGIERYAQQDDKLTVIDCYTEMTDKNGVGNPDFYWDMLHPNSAGYDKAFQKTCEAGLQIPSI